MKPYRETTLDQNNEMQHESLIATASNENTHRRLHSFAGRGRCDESSTGAMVDGDYIDSRNAAIRHSLPSCGADVPHDELQVAALTNKLAGFDVTGNESSGRLVRLTPTCPFDYNVPRAAPCDLLLLKQLSGGNTFNNRSTADFLQPITEVDGEGMLPLPVLPLRDSLLPPLCSGALMPTPLPSVLRPLLDSSASAPALPTVKRQKAEWLAPAGCDCTDKAAHGRHVRRCGKWKCTCQPKTGAGGNTTHLPECLRRRYQQHSLSWRLPQQGDCAQMIGAARNSGCQDCIYDGRAWVPDPNGRPVQHSAWVMEAL